MLMKLLKKSLEVQPNGVAATYGNLILRASAGVMIFYVHGWHKLEGGLAYLREGAPWKLAEEVAAMGFPAPIVSAFAATIVQFVCAPLLAVGLLTRLNAALLTGALSVAILQNLLADRDPQLAILYTLIMLTMVFWGGGRFSLDARLISKTERRMSMALGR